MENESSPSITTALQTWNPNHTRPLYYDHKMSIVPFSFALHTPQSTRFTLPPNWTVEAKIRTTGKFAGMVDKTYYEPGSGRKFRSLASVERHLTGSDDQTSKSLKPSNIVTFKRGSSFQLPDGWYLKEIVRQNGQSAGRVDKYYCEPGTGRMFRSRLDVERYLAGMEVNTGKTNSFRTASRTEICKTEPFCKEEMAIVAYRALATGPYGLPDGWFVMESTRKSGQSVGKIDRYYSEKSTGRVFRSRAEVERYLAKKEEAIPTPKSLEPASHIQMLRPGDREPLKGKRALAVDSKTEIPAFEVPDDTLLRDIVGKSASCVRRTKSEILKEGKFIFLLCKFVIVICNSLWGYSLRCSHKSGASKSHVSAGKLKTSCFDFSKPPAKVKWVLTGPKGDMWSPFMGESMVPESVKQQWAETFLFSINHK